MQALLTATTFLTVSKHSCPLNPKPFLMSLNIRVPARRPKGQQRGRFGEIFKVQVAQGAPSGSPMLMYNKERTRKTFIHSNAPGYSEIKDAVRVPPSLLREFTFLCDCVHGCVLACVQVSVTET